MGYCNGTSTIRLHIQANRVGPSFGVKVCIYFGQALNISTDRHQKYCTVILDVVLFILNRFENNIITAGRFTKSLQHCTHSSILHAFIMESNHGVEVLIHLRNFGLHGNVPL